MTIYLECSILTYLQLVEEDCKVFSYQADPIISNPNKMLNKLKDLKFLAKRLTESEQIKAFEHHKQLLVICPSKSSGFYRLSGPFKRPIIF